MASRTPKTPAARGAVRSAPDDTATAPARERILAVFSARAKRSGVRAVVMGDLASELRMSAMTLYKHFSSKDELVTAMVDAWALELAAIEALEWDKVDGCNAALEVLLSWADAWTASLANVSPAFFRDLRRDHPDAWTRFNGVISERKRAAIAYLQPYLRTDDVHPMAMLQMLDNLVTQAADPRFAEQLGISRREAVRTAISLWGGGALVRRAKLRAVPAAAKAPRRSGR